MTDDYNDDNTERPMTDLTPNEPAHPPAAEPPGSRTKKWLIGATLVTTGVVAGSAATYAISAQSNPGPGQFSNAQGGPGAPFGGRYQPPGGMDGQNGQQPGTQASQGSPSEQASTG